MFKSLLWEREKIINFLTIFYISHTNGIKNFLKWFIKKYLKGTYLYHTYGVVHIGC